MDDLKNKEFNHLKIHTQYSICVGAIKIDELKDYCKIHKVKCLGLSDTSNLFGALEFSEAISKSGTQPIVGTQVNFKYKEIVGSIPLISLSENGYKNLIKLSSKSYLNSEDDTSPVCSIEDLFEKKDGLVVFSGSRQGLIGKLFNSGKYDYIEEIYQKLRLAYKENFYLEIQRHNDENEDLFENFNLKKSKELKIPIIATQEVFYKDISVYEAHDALTCIGTKSYINDKNRVKLSNQHYLKSHDEMSKLFSDLPEALENNYLFPYKNNFRPAPSKPILPDIGFEKGVNADNLLKKISDEGLRNKFIKIYKIKENEIDTNKDFKKYKERLDHEIKIILEMKYSSYFLIVSDYIIWAKQNNIPVGPGRGSGAGSLVAWCISITDIDPIKFNLIFERFLNPDRISMPDFDIDFCEEKRNLVFEYLTNKYKDSVAHIITFGKLKARMVIRDVGRVLGLPYGFVDSICKMIPFDPSRPMSLTECIAIEPRFQKLINEDKRVKKLIDLSLKLEGLNRNVATHAAGVVIADKKLTETVPLYKDSDSDLLLPSTQFDMHSAENAGLVKFDFLGLKTLTVIRKAEILINEKIKDFKVDNINYEDQKIFELLSSGKTVGLFQLESSGMREALTKMKPNRLEDIIALVALYRPGPMSNIPIYNECKHGKRKPDYLHPKLEKILKPTYGVIIYQEQVMQIAQELSGFTASEADILRRAMGKKKKTELEKQKQNFIEGASKNGISKEIAAGIFLKIEPFAQYGFNKSHAAAYAIIAYQTAYLKAHYPHEFFAASMSMELSNQNKLSEFHEELKRLDINIIRPDINNCYADFKSDGKNFYYALGALKNVGFDAISNVVNERIKNGLFISLKDFIKRVNPKDINKLQLEGLVKAGAFDKINDNRQSIYNSIPNIILYSKNIFENQLVNQNELFNNDEDKNDNILEEIKDWKFEERLSKEFQTLGFFMSDHPLSQFKNLYDEFKIKNYLEFNHINEAIEVNIAATVLKIQEKKTQKGNSYAIVKFSDLSSVFELFIFSDIFEMNRNNLVEGNSLILTLSKNLSDDDNKFRRINVKKIASLNDLINKPLNEVKIFLENIEQLKKIDNIFKPNGKTNVNIFIKNNNQNLSFKLKNLKNIERKSLETLKNKGISLIIN